MNSTAQWLACYRLGLYTNSSLSSFLFNARSKGPEHTKRSIIPKPGAQRRAKAETLREVRREDAESCVFRLSKIECRPVTRHTDTLCHHCTERERW